MKFLLLQGIGDSLWALLKIEDIAQKMDNGTIDVILNCSIASPTQIRAANFLRRFDFINSVQMARVHELLDRSGEITTDGYYNYVQDGYSRINDAYTLIPNRTLERGERIETWQENYRINWHIMERFKITIKELNTVDAIKKRYGPYCCLFTGSLCNSSKEGWNRSGIWTAADWIKLGGLIEDLLGLSIIVIGAPYDEDYYTELLYPLLKERKKFWPLLTRIDIGVTVELLRRCDFFISYACGLPIITTYMNIPTIMFWRKRGNSISPSYNLSPKDDMSTSWVKEETLTSGRYLPAFYGSCTPKELFNEILRRKW